MQCVQVLPKSSELLLQQHRQQNGLGTCQSTFQHRSPTKANKLYKERNFAESCLSLLCLFKILVRDGGRVRAASFKRSQITAPMSLLRHIMIDRDSAGTCQL
jgi:hypothetical protein